ncbi:MAG TPA: adenylate/guanylate cyclase domain-containing protein [Planktothrix sp.]|jgi:class 3 adenylate cyclase
MPTTGSITVNPDTPESYSVDIEDGETLEIGRKPALGGKKKLILPFPEVSGQHAEIRCKPSGWTIVDSGSTNGTNLNGTRLTPGREYLLRSGDVVQIAHYQLRMAPPNAPTIEEEEERDQQDKTQFRIHLINATILVGDIKGFTTLMEKYAAQPTMVMLAAQRVFDVLNDEIHKNYGQLEKIAGDALMAYWHGDDSRAGQSLQAYQACYSSLRLQTLAADLAHNSEYWPFEDHPLKVDMALATGPVAAGALGHATGNPALLGDTANLVFRLEKLIDDQNSGDIIVEGLTYELAKEHFRFQSLGQHSVKGRQKQVDVYKLVGLLE